MSYVYFSKRGHLHTSQYKQAKHLFEGPKRILEYPMMFMSSSSKPDAGLGEVLDFSVKRLINGFVVTVWRVWQSTHSEPHCLSSAQVKGQHKNTLGLNGNCSRRLKRKYLNTHNPTVVKEHKTQIAKGTDLASYQQELAPAEVTPVS